MSSLRTPRPLVRRGVSQCGGTFTQQGAGEGTLVVQLRNLNGSGGSARWACGLRPWLRSCEATRRPSRHRQQTCEPLPLHPQFLLIINCLVLTRMTRGQRFQPHGCSGGVGPEQRGSGGSQGYPIRAVWQGVFKQLGTMGILAARSTCLNRHKSLP